MTLFDRNTQPPMNQSGEYEWWFDIDEEYVERMRRRRVGMVAAGSIIAISLATLLIAISYDWGAEEHVPTGASVPFATSIALVLGTACAYLLVKRRNDAFGTEHFVMDEHGVTREFFPQDAAGGEAGDKPCGIASEQNTTLFEDVLSVSSSRGMDSVILKSANLQTEKMHVPSEYLNFVLCYAEYKAEASRTEKKGRRERHGRKE